MVKILRKKGLFVKGILLILGTYFLFTGLYEARGVLVPLSVGALFAMLMVPVAEWLEGRGLGRGWAITICILIIIAFFAFIATLLGVQIATLMEGLPQLRQNIEEKLHLLANFIGRNSPLTSEEVMQWLKEKYAGLNSSATGGNGSAGNSGVSGSGDSAMQSFFYAFLTTFGDVLLIIIYIIMYLLFREKFRNFILKVTPESQREKWNEIIKKSTKLAQNYLFGRLILISILAILYAIALSIIGIDYPIVLAMLAALLSIIPYIGNVLGGGLVILMSLISGEGLWQPLAVIGAFSVVQLIESYFLEPVVVGEKVDLNPFFVIVAVIIGEAVWGIPGMIIFIPILGILVIFCRNISPLEPLAYLIGKTEGSDNKVGQKIKGWVKDVFNKK